MRVSANIGYLVMLGIVKQEKHGYSKHVKSSATGVSRPNVQTTRYWEKKLVAAFNTVEVVGKRAGTFEGRLLDSLSLLESSPGLKKNGQPKKIAPPADVLAAAEKSVQHMESNLRRAHSSIRIAKNGAILPGDIEDVRLAKEALLDLDGIVTGLAKRVRELKADFGLDSTL